MSEDINDIRRKVLMQERAFEVPELAELLKKDKDIDGLDWQLVALCILGCQHHLASNVLRTCTNVSQFTLHKSHKATSVPTISASRHPGVVGATCNNDPAC